MMMGLAFISSCSEYNEPELSYSDVEPTTRSSDPFQEEGRFDNEPFNWDYSFSTDSLQDIEGLAIYPVETVDSAETSKRLVSRGRTTRPGGSGTGNHRPGTSTSVTTDQMLLVDPNIVYVGAAFPESTFAKDYSKELLYPRNPIDVYTNFPDPYIGEITKETGALGYKKFMKEIVRSSEYKNFLKGGGREGLDFQCTEVFSYSDIEKALSSNAGFAKIFSAKVQSSSKKTNIKSRLFAQLISRNFTVTMDVPSKGFFKDKSHDTGAENPVYIRSLSYGKVAIMAIESEYTFEEVKKAIEAGVKFNLFSGGANFTSKDKEILQKATFTICVISDESTVTQYFDSFDKIKDIFKISYSENHYGLPIYCKGFYTKDNSIFTVTTSGNNRGSRPGTGGTRPPIGGGGRGRH